MEAFSRIWLAILFALCLPSIFVLPWLYIRARRRYFTFDFQKKFWKLYEGITFSNNPAPGLVEFRFHTYDGVLIWGWQCKHAGYATKDHALELINRAIRRNLTRGLLTPGGLFVPFLSIPEYFSNKRRIANFSAPNGSTHTTPMASHSIDVSRDSSWKPPAKSQAFEKIFRGLSFALLAYWMIGIVMRILSVPKFSEIDYFMIGFGLLPILASFMVAASFSDG